MTHCQMFGAGMMIILLAIIVFTAIISEEARYVMRFFGIVFSVGGYLLLMAYLLANCKLN